MDLQVWTSPCCPAPRALEHMHHELAGTLDGRVELRRAGLPCVYVTSRNTHKPSLMYFQAEVPFPALPCPSWIHSGTSGISRTSGTTQNEASPCDLTLLHHSYCAYCPFCPFCLSYVPSHTASQVPSLFCPTPMTMFLLASLNHAMHFVKV